MLKYQTGSGTTQPASRRITELTATSPIRERVTVVTLLEHPIRSVIDLATDDQFSKLHVDSVAEAVGTMRACGGRAILISPSVVERYSMSEIADLVRKNPGVTPVAVVDTETPKLGEALLALGGCGVRRVVYLKEREGWHRLRTIIDQAGNETTAVILGVVLEALADASDDARRFFTELIRLAPTTPNVRGVAHHLGVEPSTLMSRFFRARLPAPKAYLVMCRLSYVAAFLAQPVVTIGDVANRLSYSSPQGLGRHIRTTLGLSGNEFRREFSFDRALSLFVERLIVPHWRTFRDFSPLGAASV